MSTLLQLYQVLRGKVLRRSEIESDSDLSGGSWYYERTWAIKLFEDDTYHFQLIKTKNISGGGLSLPQESVTEYEGVWKVEMVENQPSLVLYHQNGEIFVSHPTQDGGQGVQYLSGRAWDRYLIRE
jgi:hypothetical protein